MITKNDCLLLLANIEESGVDTKEQVRKLIKDGMTVDIIKFINDNRQLDLSAFYEKLRWSYNHKKSQLYKNIVKEIEEPQEVLTTLSAMLTQILLFSKTTEDKQLFMKHARANEISLVLSNYFKTYDISTAIKLLRLIKADLKCLESVK